MRARRWPGPVRARRYWLSGPAAPVVSRGCGSVPSLTPRSGTLTARWRSCDEPEAADLPTTAGLTVTLAPTAIGERAAHQGWQLPSLSDCTDDYTDDCSDVSAGGACSPVGMIATGQ